VRCQAVSREPKHVNLREERGGDASRGRDTRADARELGGASLYHIILPACNHTFVKCLAMCQMYGTCKVSDGLVPCRRSGSTGALPFEPGPKKLTCRPCATRTVAHATPTGRDEEQHALNAPIPVSTRQAHPVPPHLRSSLVARSLS
jgi:hypothetical protein